MKENGFVACVGEKINAYTKDLGIEGRMLLNVKDIG